MEIKYMLKNLFPNLWIIMDMAAILVAGPAKMKTRMLPGLNPMKKNPNATGIDAVGHTYMGTAMAKRINKDTTGSPAMF